MRPLSKRLNALTLAVAVAITTPAAMAGDSATLAAEQERMSEQLIDLGYTPVQAETMAGELTEDDLQVLLGHPKMMQRAGHVNATDTAWILGTVLIVGIILLAVAAG